MTFKDGGRIYMNDTGDTKHTDFNPVIVDQKPTLKTKSIVLMIVIRHTTLTKKSALLQL